MAKTARKGAAKKPSAPPAIKPVKQTLTKSALINLLAEENEIPRKTAVGVYTTLENLESSRWNKRGSWTWSSALAAPSTRKAKRATQLGLRAACPIERA